MRKEIEQIFRESLKVKEETLESNLDTIVAVVEEIRNALKQNKKLLFFGNGGSAADSQHIAAEFIGRFKKERQALAAIALTTDTSILTALSNDYGGDIIFSRQIEGLGQPGDIAFGISTSGNSRNVIEGIKKAKSMRLITVSLTGCHGGELAKLTDYSLIVPSSTTARIQEAHMCIYHTICDLVDRGYST